MAITRNGGPSSASPDARRRNPGPPDPDAPRRNPGRTSRAPDFRPRASKRPFYDGSMDYGHESDLQSTETPSLSDDGSRLVASVSGANPQRQRPSLPERAAPRRSSRTNTARLDGRNPKANSAGGSPSQESPLRYKSGDSTRRNALPSPAKRRKLSPHHDKQEPAAFIPDWTDVRVPFDCWTDIFLYAASNATDGLATTWLIHAATTCRALAEPALTALYRCPSIRHPSKAKRLASLLDRPPSTTRFNYRTKVEALHINIHLVPQAVLYQLIHPLSRLKELIIYTPMDQPPYRELDKNLRWHYPDDVFRALEPDRDGASNEKPFPTAIKSWEWSGRLLGGCVPSIRSMARIHETPSFSQLTKLSFTNFQIPSLSNLRLKPGSEEGELRDYHEDGVVIEALAHAISRLACLSHLVFESSTVMNDRLLPLLPKHLAHLELINCWEVKSEHLASFLRTHGRDLRTLTLLHNQSLDLGFLTDLSETCPRLRELHMNLSYYRHHDCVNDADPMYDQALLPSQVPNWPSSLRVLDIEHIRDLSVEAAEACLQSLIDSAGKLPNLRHLAIKTMLDIPWQARATMRREWRGKMEQVYLRPSASPRACTTLRPPMVMNGQSRRQSPMTSRKTLPSRRSGRIAAYGRDSSDARASQGLRRQPAKPSYRDPDTDEDDSGASGSEHEHEHQHQHQHQHDSEANGGKDAAAAGGARGSGGHAIQGLCNTVNILFDNQKVREWQYAMEDFLDEDEDESEDEWQGDYDEDDSIVVFR